MKSYYGVSVYLGILLAMPLGPRTVRLYVSNQNAGTIDVIDPLANKVVQTIGDMTEPGGAVFSPDGRRAYVSDESEHVLNVLDTKTGNSIKKVPLSGLPNLPAVTKDGKRVLVAIWAPSDSAQYATQSDAEPQSKAPPAGAVDIVDTDSLEKVKTLPMRAPMHDIYTTPDGKYAVVGSPRGKFLTVIDLQTEQPVWEVQFDPRGLDQVRDAGGVLTFAMESGPDGSTRRMFVELNGLNGFSVVDFAKRKEVARVELPVATFGYQALGPTHGTGITPDGKSLWVCSRGSNNVFAYSLPELKLLGQIPMAELAVPGPLGRGGEPTWLTFTPDSKTAYVTLGTANLVSAIDVKTLKEVARIPVGAHPRNVAAVVLP